MENSGKKATLVIMAAGIGSRYGKGIKQLDAMGPNGEIIMDYSIYDAKRAGFNKVVFIIRRDLEHDFREIIGDRITEQMDTDYVFQELADIPDGFADKLNGRAKPWGTGQAVLACRGTVKEPFAVINADDYYGREAFAQVYDYLAEERQVREYSQLCMAGFLLGNTLSENGTVTRGVCDVDNSGYLTGVRETFNIIKTPEGAGVRGEDGAVTPLAADSHVSMNMWGLTPELFDILDEGFTDFLRSADTNDKKCEYLLPTVIDTLIKSGKARVKVLETKDKWFGVTYQEDRETVRRSFTDLIAKGVYPSSLYVK